MTTPTVLYTGKTLTTGGREGISRSDDGRLDLILSSPASKVGGTNPEQLFAAGWSACFIGALGKGAQSMGVRLPADTAVAAEIDLTQGDEGYALAARLGVKLPGLPRDTAHALIAFAHGNCPYSKATRGNLDVTITLL